MFRNILKIRSPIIICISMMLFGTICIGFTGPILAGAAQYWGINQSIEEAEALANKLTEYGKRRDAMDDHIIQLKQERQRIADNNEIAAWCLDSSNTNFAKGVRNYILIGVLCIFVMGCVSCIYGGWSLGDAIMRNEKSSIKREALQEASENVQNSPSEEGDPITEEVLADVDRIISGFEWDLI